jgi:hypothetical protein
MFWNQNTTHQTPEKCFGIETQHIKRLRNVLDTKHNTTHQTTKKCSGIKSQHTKRLRNVLESKHNTSNT